MRRFLLATAIAAGVAVIVALLMVATTAESTAPPATTALTSSTTSTTLQPPVTPAPRVVFNYEIATRGDVTASFDEFATVADATLNDSRGWSLDNRVRFERSETDPDFTLYLSAPSSMSSFSKYCTSNYSCRAGDNVIVNERRWLEGAGLAMTLDEYRQLVINHELGHWLGLGHPSCPRAGGPALIMQQQSKGSAYLGRCTPNAWPLESEQAAVAKRLKL